MHLSPEYRSELSQRFEFFRLGCGNCEIVNTALTWANHFNLPVTIHEYVQDIDGKLQIDLIHLNPTDVAKMGAQEWSEICQKFPIIMLAEPGIRRK